MIYKSIWKNRFCNFVQNDMRMKWDIERKIQFILPGEKEIFCSACRMTSRGGYIMEEETSSLKYAATNGTKRTAPAQYSAWINQKSMHPSFTVLESWRASKNWKGFGNDQGVSLKCLLLPPHPSFGQLLLRGRWFSFAFWNSGSCNSG